MTILASFAFAHHGFQSRYDLGKPIWIEGEVTQAYFGHPHSELTVSVAPDLSVPRPAPTLGPASSFLNSASLNVPTDLPGTTVELELPPTAQYTSLGDRISVGDLLTLQNVETVPQIRSISPPIAEKHTVF